MLQYFIFFKFYFNKNNFSGGNPSNQCFCFFSLVQTDSLLWITPDNVGANGHTKCVSMQKQLLSIYTHLKTQFGTHLYLHVALTGGIFLLPDEIT